MVVFGRPRNEVTDRGHYGNGYGAPTVSYGYDGQKLAGVTDGRSTPAVNVSYTYDSQWRLASETEGAGVVTYAYTTPAGDDLASYRIDPPSGQTGITVTANMSYDTSVGRLTRIDWSPVSGGFIFAYNDDGQYTNIQFPNGQTRTFAYDNQGRLTSLANLDTQAHNLVTYAYGYDYDWPSQSYTSLGNRTSVAVTGSPTLIPNGTSKYMYDANQQLTGVTRADGNNYTYGYDAIGNRLNATWVGQTSTLYNYFLNSGSKNTPRLKNAGGPDLTYDANGNVTSFGYTWDAANRLAAISSIQFQYDAQNRRAVYTPAPGGGAPVKYVSAGLNTVAERSTNTARANDYLFGPGIDEPLARRASDGSIQYYAIDGLGSITALTSATGQINRAIMYDEWGAVTSGAVDLFGYTGREIATPSGSALWFNRARHYASNWGRFVSEDPTRIVGQGPYAYALNSPASNTDPLGLASGPAQAHVCCDGKGGFTVCWDQTPAQGSEKCTLEHEQDHIKWFGCHPPYDQLCKGKKKGEKNFTLQSQADDNALECSGYEVQYKCMKKLLPQLSGGQKSQWWDGMNKLAYKAKKDFQCNTSPWF